MGVLVGKNAGSSISVTATFGGKSGSVTGISVSQINPILEFVNYYESPTTYDGTQKCLGYIAYTGDGTVYYQVIKATSQPSVPSASDSGWINIGGGDYIYGSDEDVATEAGTYYVFLKSTAGTSYTAVNPKSAGNTVVNKVTPSAPALTAGVKNTYDGSYVYAKAANVAGNPAGKIYYGSSAGATTYSLNVAAGATTATNMSSMGRVNVGSRTIYAFFRPTDTTNWNDSVNVSTTASVTNKAANPLTISPTSKTIYSITSNGTGNPADYTFNTFTITPSNAQGDVTYSSSVTGKATVTSGGVVSYVSAGSATITVTAAGNSNYLSGSKTCTVTCTLDTVSNSNYSPSNYVASATIGSGLTAAGGTATVTASASHSAYNLYTSTYVDSTTHTVTDSVSWVITTQTFTPSGGSASTITRFSKSSNTLSHTTMGTNVGTDYVKITATNGSSSSATATAEKSITNGVESISLAVGGSTGTKTINFGDSATTSVTATYTSGATGTITPTSVTSSDTTVATVS